MFEVPHIEPYSAEQSKYRKKLKIDFSWPNRKNWWFCPTFFTFSTQMFRHL